MIILGERASGKTDQLLKECARNNGIFVTQHKSSMVLNAERHGISGGDVYSFQDLVSGHLRGITGRKVYIDEAQSFINYIVGTQGSSRLSVGGLVIASESILDYRLNYGLITKYKATIMERIKLAIDAFKHGV